MNDGNRQRILRATTATLSWQPLTSEGEPATVDPGVVTVGVTRSDGTAVIAAGHATSGTLLEARTVALSAADTAELDILTATWKVGATVVAVTYAEIVGAFMFTVADLRAAQPSTESQGKYTPERIIAARAEVETFFADCTNVAFVPSFATWHSNRRSSATCTVTLPRPYLRRVRWARWWTSPTSSTDFTADEVEAINSVLPSDHGTIDLGWAGRGGRIEVGYEHGLDAPPYDVKRVAMIYCRILCNKDKEPSRLQPFTTPNGDAVFDRAGTRWRPTGFEEIDEVLNRWDHRQYTVVG